MMMELVCGREIENCFQIIDQKINYNRIRGHLFLFKYNIKMK